jgi:predicted enzyme related to lactoylglutathione lyase
MIEVKRLQNLHVLAPDMAASTAFYAQLFGWRPKFSDGDRWTQYEVQGAAFALSGPAEAVPQQSGGVPVFEVASFEGVDAQITAAGGQVLGLRDMGAHGSVLTLRDPGGQALQLFCRAPKG